MVAGQTGGLEVVKTALSDVRFGSKADIALECAPDGGQVQAAVLTDCWAWWSSYCTGLM